MVIKLYYLKGSPGVRSVLVTAKALGVKIDALQPIDFWKGEHLTPEFLKLNPQHTVPILDENGFVFWDSHAILAYMVEKYGKDDSLYPKDLFKRAVINQRLYFDSGILYTVLKNIDLAYRRGETTKLTPKLIGDVIEAYDFLEEFLEGHQWVAGDYLSIADFSLVPTTTILNIHVEIDAKYQNILNWVKRVKELPCFEDDPEHTVNTFDLWETNEEKSSGK